MEYIILTVLKPHQSFSHIILINIVVNHIYLILVFYWRNFHYLTDLTFLLFILKNPIK
jgi:hypothetical protein